MTLTKVACHKRLLRSWKFSEPANDYDDVAASCPFCMSNIFICCGYLTVYSHDVSESSLLALSRRLQLFEKVCDANLWETPL